MPLYKFRDGDLFYNQIKAHPSSSFFVYNSSIYYNKQATKPGSSVAHATMVPVGHVSLFEYNVDRPTVADLTMTIGPSSSIPTGSDTQHLAKAGPTGPNVRNTGLIYPWVYKGIQKVAFKNIKRVSYIHNYMQGDVITGSYQLSSSITRQRYTALHLFNHSNRTGSALKHPLRQAKMLGPHYDFPSGSSVATNVIQIPSIFYGSKIKKGTVDLKYYMTGNVVGRLKDSRQDGALIQSEGTEGSANDGQIAGVVLYKEGFIILTGSWNLATTFSDSDKIGDKDYLGNAIGPAENGSWLNFGFGANDKVTAGANLTNGSASFEINFAGTHRVPTVTMLAHANKGELNYSNNLTYLSASQTSSVTSGSYQYIQSEKVIKNIYSSSYAEPTGSLVKTTYINKIGIYDRRKKLIGIASLAKPVKKTEDRDLTFKLKLDI
jgi:hypothetical protein